MQITVLDGQILNPGDVSWAPLERYGKLTVYESTSLDELPRRVKGADIILVNKTPIHKESIGWLGNCKMIGVLATGTNNLDLPELAQKGITVCNVPGYGVEDVAQHALALLLELARNTRLHTESVRNGDWQKSGDWCYWLKQPLSLSGLTMGIIGFGSIGQALGKYANALGMEVVANARHKTVRVDYPFEYRELPDLLAASDVISLHCPLTPQTDKLINHTAIAMMKSGAILINTARGGLLDEEAVAEALKTGKLGGVGVDVLSVEPPQADNPLLSAPNTLITPHIAWATANARQRIIDMTAENIEAFIQGNPRNLV